MRLFWVLSPKKCHFLIGKLNSGETLVKKAGNK